MSGVPVMARELITHPDFAKHDLSSLMSLGGGGAQLPPDLVAKIDASVATARPNTGYGMTETCGIITAVSGDFFVDKPASCGRAMPIFDVRIVDDGGENIYCAEVEAVLHQHDAVAECSVFGVADDRLGEEVGAAVVMRPGQGV